MNMNFVLMFIVLSVVNVVFSTIRSIVTIKGGKLLASIVSGGYFAFYNVMLIYTVADFPMWQKCAITGVCNIVGVFAVKWVEELMQKDKLWKVEATVYGTDTLHVSHELFKANIPYNYIQSVGKYTIFNAYCATQEQSAAAKKIFDSFNAKYFVSESKTL